LDAEVAPVAFGDVIQEGARNRFGSEVTCGTAEKWEQPAGKCISASFSVESTSNGDMSIHLSISPDLEAALGGSAIDKEGSEEQHLVPRLAVANNSADILMHVEMPVTIILGCTTMLLKDLLKLTDGSVVELDQMLDEEVEVRVNNCVIAYGEVVAVDGNYAVRILRMAPAQNGDLRRELPEKAA
jgi:flagellar motor switch protein FliN/FliY